MTGGWVRCSDAMPPLGKRVKTKIDDSKGCRNEVFLTPNPVGSGVMWFTDGPNAMYVYYRPTHWWRDG